MAHWYVDRSATGTGSGNTPADASTNLRSLLSASSMEWNDYVWVRRTHYQEDWAVSIGKASFTPGSHTVIRVAGWPTSGDPFYEYRIGDARSAGWDTDAATPFAGINYPSLIQSVAGANAANGWGFAAGHNLYNCAVVNSNVAGGVSSFMVANSGGWRSNIWFLSTRFGQLVSSVLDMTIIATAGLGGNDALFDDSCVHVKKMTLAESCAFNNGIFNTNAFVFVEELVLNTSSINALSWSNIGPYSFSDKYVGKVRGLGAFIQGTALAQDAAPNGGQQHVMIDDWFGQGPAQLKVFGGIQHTRVDSSVAVYSGSPCMIMRANSHGASNLHHVTAFANYNHQVRKLVQCFSGVPVKARMPFWSLVGSIDNFDWFAALPVAGGAVRPLNFTNSGLLPGSAGFWSGTSLAAGSAYLAYAEWTPTESGSAWLTFKPSVITPINTGYIAYPPFFEVTS